MKILSILLMLSATVSFGSCSKTQDSATKPKTYVLVHGAFQGPYAWKFVKAQLEAKGQRVVVIELPGHGSDMTNPATLSIDAYRDEVVSVINAIEGKVILVGHSMGGMVITATAEKIPLKIEKLVYIAAFVPATGQNIQDLASTDATSILGPNLKPSPDQLTLDISKDKLASIFCADGSAEVKQSLIDNYRAEPAIPFGSPVTVTAASYGSVDKYYIHTLQDMAIGIDNQNKMAKAAGITAVYTLNSSHCPFLSKPDEVTSILLEIGKK